MSDDADIADENIELGRLAAIEACRRQSSIPPKGSCWFCDEVLPPQQKFCDSECATDFEREQAALARAGRREEMNFRIG